MKLHHFGDPNGAPLVFFHGMPSSGDEGELLHETAKQNAVHVIAPDRPGFGDTAFESGRTLFSTAQQMAQLIQSMGIKRYAVAGCSGGGPYTFALAAAAPEAVHFAAPISGMYPFKGWRSLAGMHLNNRVVMALAHYRPDWIKPLFNVTLKRMHRNLHKIYFDALKVLPAEDIAFFSQDWVVPIMMRALQNSMRQGVDGAVFETQLFARAWDIPVERIRCPLIAWHGERDTAVPIALASAYFQQHQPASGQPYQLVKLPTAHISTLAAVLELKEFWQGVTAA